MPREITNTDFSGLEGKVEGRVPRTEFEREWNRLMQAVQGLQQQIEALKQVVSTVALIQERQVHDKEDMQRLTDELDELYAAHSKTKEKVDLWVARFGGAMGLYTVLMGIVGLLLMVRK